MAISRILSGTARRLCTVRSFLSPRRRGVPQSGMRLLPGNGPPKRDGPDAQRSLFCLALHGVFRAPPVARRAVGFYPAFSPLPEIRRSTGGLFSVTLSVNGDLRLRPPRVLRGVLSGGVRTFLWQPKHPRAPATSDRLPPAAPGTVRRNLPRARGLFTRLRFAFAFRPLHRYAIPLCNRRGRPTLPPLSPRS